MTTIDDPKGKQYKRFSKIDEEWRSSQMSAQTPEVYKMITKVAMDAMQNEMAEKFDEDLAKLKEQAKVAGEPYKLAKKELKLKMEFLVETLRSRGEDVPSIEDFLRAAADGGETE